MTTPSVHVNINIHQPSAELNAYVEVEVKNLGGTSYECYYHKDGKKYHMSPPYIRNKDEYENLAKWFESLSIPELRAGAKMYYDLWNFVDSDPIYRQLYQAFEDELDFRLRKVQPKVGTINYDTTEQAFHTYDGKRWKRICMEPS